MTIKDQVTVLTERFFRPDYTIMLATITELIDDAVATMQAAPLEYTEHGADEPTIDIRLCVDNDGWIFRTGDASFDQRHSRYCSASCIGLNTQAGELLEQLIDDVLDQAAEANE